MIQKYFGNLRPMMKEGYTYLNLQVTFDQEPLEETVHDMHTISQGKAQVYLAPLQAANTEKIGWLHPTHHAQCLRDYEKFVNEALSHLHNGMVQMQGYWKTQDPDPPKVALIWKLIYDGMTKEEHAKEADGAEAVWVIHIIAKKSNVRSVTGAMDFILSLPSYTAVNKLGTAMVPQYQWNSGMAAKLKLLKVIKKQKYFQDWIYTATLDGALGLDLVNLKGQMLRKFVMDTKCDDTNTDLFLDCNPSWDEMSFTVSYSKKFTKEASFKSSNIAAYAFCAFGDVGLQWFSPNMAVVKTMGWDEEKNWPITANECLLDKILKIPTPDSALGQMFDFSEMELDSAKKGAEAARPSCSSPPDDDTASKGSDAFSQLSTFSRFYNPDGTERMATD